MSSSNVKSILLSTIVSGMLIGCGGGGGSSVTSSNSTGAGGGAQKGPFKEGQVVTAQKLKIDGTLDTNVPSITTQTDSLGKFKFSSLSWSGPTEFTIEGEYLDESTGEYVSGGFLSAITDIKEGTIPKVNINILTHIASESIKEQMKANADSDPSNDITIEEAKSTAKKVVSKVFKINLENTELEELDLTNENRDNATDEQKAANTQLLKLSAALSSTIDPISTLQKIATDLKDGEVDDEAEASFEELKQKESEVKLSEIAQNIKSIINLDTIPDSEDFLNGTMSLNNTLVFNDKLEVSPSNSSEDYEESNSVLVSGIIGTKAANISIINGEYSLDGGKNWINSSVKEGKVSNGDTLVLRAVPSSNFDTKTTTVVTIGGVDFDFDITTEPEFTVNDTRVKAFDFVSKTKQSLNTEVISDPIQIEGINAITNVSVTNGILEVSSNGLDNWNNATQVENGNYVRVKHTTSNDYNARVKSIVTFGSEQNQVIAEFKSYTQAQDRTPNFITIATKYDQNLFDKENIEYVDFNPVTVTGFTGEIEVKVINGEFTVDGGTTWYSQEDLKNLKKPIKITPNTQVDIRHLSSSEFNTKTTSFLTLGTKIVEFSSFTIANGDDTLPNEFNLKVISMDAHDTRPIVPVDINKLIESNEITLDGINTEVNISVSEGTQYSIDGGQTWNSQDGIVSKGDTLKVRHTSSKNYLEKTESIVKVGDYETKFISYTKAPIDTIPNPFGFALVENVDINAEVISEDVYIRGINTQTNISIIDGEFSLDEGVNWQTTGMIADNQKVRVKHISAKNNEEKTETILTIGNDTDGKYETKFISVTKKTIPNLEDVINEFNTQVYNGSFYSFTPKANNVDEWEISENKPSWLSLNKRTGQISGTPNSVSLEKVYKNIVLTAKNSSGEVSLPSFDLEVKGLTPTVILGNIKSQYSIYNDIEIQANVNDTSDDTHTFSLNNAPSFLSIDENGKIFVSKDTLTTANKGTYKFTISAEDSTGKVGTSSEVSFEIVEFSNVDTPPTISGTPSLTIEEGNSYLFNPISSDINDNSEKPLIFTMTGNPSWLSINSSTGTVSGTPSNDDVGITDEITIKVTDNTGLSDSLEPFKITVSNVNNKPIKVGSIAEQTISTDTSSYSLDVKPYFDDIDLKHGNEVLTYEVTFDSGELLPKWLAFDSNTGILTTTSSNNVGVYQMKVTATDKSGEKVVQNFTINIEKDKFTQALEKIDSIDPELEDIDTKLQEAKDILSTLTSDKATVITTLISIAEIANSDTINDLISIKNSNDGKDYNGTNLNALVRNSVMDFVNIDSLIENASTTKFTTVTTNKMHEIATKLKELSDNLGKYYQSANDSYTYQNETITYDDANALRATILGIAFKLENLSAYQWGIDSDFATQEASESKNEYINFDINRPSILNRGNFFKLIFADRVLTAKEYLKQAVNIALRVPIGYEGEFKSDYKTDLQAIKTAFDGKGQYTYTDFDASDDEASVTIDLNKLFATPLQLSDLGSNWQYSCRNGKLIEGSTAAEKYGYTTCEYSYELYDATLYTWNETPKIEVQTSPIASSSKIDDIILNIKLKKNNQILTGQALLDYLYKDDFKLSRDDISGKSFNVTSVDNSAYVKFEVLSDGTGTEVGYNSDKTQESSENFTWDIEDGKLKIMFNDTSVDFYIFDDTPSNGVIVKVHGPNEAPFDAIISDFKDIEPVIQTLTFEELTANSFLVLGDGWYDEMTFNNSKNAIDGIEYYRNDSGIYVKNGSTWSIDITPTSNKNQVLYVDSDTGEKGTFTTFKTELLTGYTNVFKTTINFQLTEDITYFWEVWDWNPTDSGYTIENLDQLESSFLNNMYTLMGNKIPVMINNSGNVVKANEVKDAMGNYYERSTLPEDIVGTWEKDISNNYLKLSLKNSSDIVNEIIYLRVLNDNGVYKIEEKTTLFKDYKYSKDFISGTELSTYKVDKGL